MSVSKKKVLKSFDVTILGLDYEVEIGKIPSGGARGLTLCGENKIVILDSLPDAVKIQTFIHEVVEVINYELEMELDHAKITQLEAGLFSSLEGISKFVEILET